MRGRPKANPDPQETDENTPVDVYPLSNDQDPERHPLILVNVQPPSIFNCTLSNDYCPENDPVTVISAGPADIGIATLDPRTGLLTYIPDPLECHMICRTGQHRQYTATIPYTIMAEDDKLTDSTNVYITVKCVQVAPVANDDYDETE